MNKHTVCLLNDSFPPVIDGVANVVINYAENIEKYYGHAIVVTPAVPGSDDSCFDFPVLRYPSIDTRKLMGYVTGYPFSPEINARVRKEGTELLHLHCPATSALFARQLKDTAGLPLIMTYHTKYDIDIANLTRSKLLQDSAVSALVQNVSACDEVWTVSRGAGENLRALGYEGDYIVMENGVDMPHGKADDEEIAAAVSWYDLPEGVPFFLFVGRLMWYKGIRIILDALAAIRARGTDFRMVFIGDGGDRAEIGKYVKELKLDDVCIFTGAISDRGAIRAWYSRADLFLFPSTFDTNGLVVREAAACSLAAVMIAGSCAAEGVTDGRNGFLIEENAGAMAARLTELCKNPEAVKKAGENAGRELYISWEDAVRKAAERYEVVLDNFRSGLYPRKPTLKDRIESLQRTESAAKEKLVAARLEAVQLIEKHRTAVWEYLDRYL